MVGHLRRRTQRRDEVASHGRVQPGLACSHAAHGIDEVPWRGRLQQVAIRPGEQYAADVGILPERREHQNAGRIGAPPQGFGESDTAHARHPQVGDDDGGNEFGRSRVEQRQGARPVRRGPDHVQVRSGLKQHDDA